MNFTEQQKRYLYILTVIVLPFFLYFNTIYNDYTADDLPLIRDNPTINHGLMHVSDLLTKSTFFGYYHQNYGAYRPFTMLNFAIETQFFGLTPGISHFFNILYFSLTCLMLFIVMNKIFGEKYLFIVFISTIIFIVHPIHVEVVANIKSRDEIFALLFGLLLPIHFLNLYHQRGKIKYFLFSVLFFVLGICSKENALFFVVIFPIYLYLTGDFKIKQILLLSLVYVTGLAFFLLPRYFFLDSFPLQHFSEAKTLFHAHTFLEKLSTGCYLFLFNCKQLIIPYPLSWDYGYKEIDVQHNFFYVFIALLTTGVIVYSIIKGVLNKKIQSIFGLIFLISLLPYSHLLLNLAVNTADRFLFVPSIALCTVPIFCFSYFHKKSIPLSKLLTIFCLTVILLFAALTINQNTVWKDTITVFKYGTETAPSSYYTHKSYGLWLSNLADSSNSQEEKTNLYNQAAISCLVRFQFHI